MTEAISGQNRNAGKMEGGYLKIKWIFMLVLILLVGGLAWSYLSQGKSSGVNNQNNSSINSQKQSPQSQSVPSRDADIIGMIESVKGNQITVLKFDPSNIPAAAGQQTGSKQKTDMSENAISLGTSSSGMPGAGGPPAGFSGGSSGPPAGFGGSSSGTSTRATILSELKTASKGTETITVPIGIPILKAGATGVAFTQLASDTVVEIWLDEAGNESKAAFVNITGKVSMSNSNN
jgi:hypothetical protein